MATDYGIFIMLVVVLVVGTAVPWLMAANASAAVQAGTIIGNGQASYSLRQQSAANSNLPGCTNGQCAPGNTGIICTYSQNNIGRYEPASPETSCANEKDDDCNGLVDCADPNCAGAEYAVATRAIAVPSQYSPVDEYGNVYAYRTLSNGNAEVFKYDGRVWVTVGVAPTSDPQSMIMSSNGILYIVDQHWNNSPHAEVYEYDGNAWTSTGLSDLAQSVSDIKADRIGNIYVLDNYDYDNTSIYKYNNYRWSSTNYRGEYVDSILSGSSQNIYANGQHLYRYDGNTWSVIGLSSSLSSSPQNAQLSFASNGNVYAGVQGTNDQPAVYEFTNGIWWSLDYPGTFQISRTIGKNSGIYVIGSTWNAVEAYEYDGYTWTSLSLPDSSAITYVASDQSGNLYIYFADSALYRYAGSAWSKVDTANVVVSALLGNGLVLYFVGTRDQISMLDMYKLTEC